MRDMIHDIINALIKLLEHSVPENKRKGKKVVHNSETHKSILHLVFCIILVMLLVKFATILFAGTK
jgi:hypothetical protein